jgi:transketolase N-terminal domain/subunit
MRDHKGLNEITRNIRKDIVTMIHGSKSGHPGGSLSAVEILTALYFDEMSEREYAKQNSVYHNAIHKKKKRILEKLKKQFEN